MIWWQISLKTKENKTKQNPNCVTSSCHNCIFKDFCSWHFCMEISISFSVFWYIFLYNLPLRITKKNKFCGEMFQPKFFIFFNSLTVIIALLAIVKLQNRNLTYKVPYFIWSLFHIVYFGQQHRPDRHVVRN